jgi:hypothetical protein
MYRSIQEGSVLVVAGLWAILKKSLFSQDMRGPVFVSFSPLPSECIPSFIV